MSERIFQLMLFVYPRDFRREYGWLMAQVFRDCHRAAQKGNETLATSRLWRRAVIDLIKAAPKEHWNHLRKDNSIMSRALREIIALVGGLVIAAAAFVLLGYGRKNQVEPILMVGHTLDALATVGIIGNIVTFLLVKAAKLNPVRAALWCFGVVTAALFVLAAVVGGRVDPQFSLAKIAVAYLVSFVFWFGLHWVWAKGRTPLSAN
jgi:hypothetical protein